MLTLSLIHISDGALLCSLHRHLHCHLTQVFPAGKLAEDDSEDDDEEMCIRDSVDAVNQNCALLELVSAADEGQEGAFAGAGGTDKSHGFPRGNMERNALQHPFAGNIAEPDIAELNFCLLYTSYR